MILTSNYHYLQIMTHKTKIQCPSLEQISVEKNVAFMLITSNLSIPSV
jgi:hypothetical protein